MPLFSRRKPTPGGGRGVPADEPGTFSVPEPIFESVAESEPVELPDGPVEADAEASGPRDPNAPPVPGGSPAAPLTSPPAVEPGSASEPTAEDLEAATARFRRPGSRGRQKRASPSARRARRAARSDAARSKAARPKTPVVVSDAVDPESEAPARRDAAAPGARTSQPARPGGSAFSPAMLLLAVVAVTLLAALLAVVYRPGEGAWAVVTALVVVGLVQLVLVVASIVVIRRRARRAGVVALVLLLVVNPVTAMTVGGLVFDRSGGQSAAGGAREEDHDPIWDTYPGSAYVDAKETLDGPSYEAFVDRSETVLSDIRTALTAEFGFEWVERQPAESELDHNGYGGDSMLYEYTAPVWQTTTTVRTFDEKSRVVEIIRGVLLRSGIANLDLQNAPSSWREPGELTEQYGGETLDTQALWDLHTYGAITSAGSFGASIVDLTRDRAGTVAKDRQFDVTAGMALEGIELHLDSYALLKEADRADYLAALEPYADLDKPK
ncbi:hypothetical protein ASF83_01450 [Plantibacter sp. Leaf171]|uniref:hypothetical protein n=1 Tax=unclassified Plantibacter TaxID=2624265 RepID=UPI0006FC2089|nr:MULTISPECIES: hypothetical protein [unclassified Plantibacter]KQM17791.1 hypothetical protein ASE44_01465 [Plantibacter sp. Leaf1]KQR60573.1 hypothetical protein ASF83_01450 [Plantibacter sp. Leaf171]